MKIPHLYSNPDLTFGELQDTLLNFLRGAHTEVTYEKLDGQSVVLSYQNNTPFIALGTMTPLTLEIVAEKYKDAPTVLHAYKSVIEDWNEICTTIPSNTLHRIFECNRYITAEILDPNNRNLIWYSNDRHLVLHGVFDVNHIECSDSRSILNSVLDEILHSPLPELNYEFSIQNPIRISKESTPQRQASIGTIKGTISRLLSANSLSLLSTIDEYYTLAIDNRLKLLYPDISFELRQYLIERYAHENRSNLIRSIKTLFPRVGKYTYAKIKDGDVGMWEYRQRLTMDLTSIVLYAGSMICKEIENPFCQNIQKTRAQIDAELHDVAHAFRQSNFKYKSTISYYSDLLNTAGGFSNFNGIEGVVFRYKGQRYKITSVFTALNQLMSTVKYKK